MTSHDVVGVLRRQLGERRVGHAGTLDPDATGVLVVAVGRATRLMRFVVGADKEYTGTIVLGTSPSPTCEALQQGSSDEASRSRRWSRRSRSTGDASTSWLEQARRSTGRR